MVKKKLILKPFFIFLLLVGTILTSSTNTFAQWVEDYGNIGTLKTFKGQVRDAADGLIPYATLQLTKLDSKQNYSIESDDNGIFIVKNLASGEYKVTVKLSGFNQTEFTVNISPHNPAALRKFIIIRMSPGCASGGSVELEDKVIKEQNPL